MVIICRNYQAKSCNSYILLTTALRLTTAILLTVYIKNIYTSIDMYQRTITHRLQHYDGS